MQHPAATNAANAIIINISIGLDLDRLLLLRAIVPSLGNKV